MARVLKQVDPLLFVFFDRLLLLCLVFWAGASLFTTYADAFIAQDCFNLELELGGPTLFHFLAVLALRYYSWDALALHI